MTMHVVSTTGEKRGFRAWRKLGREGKGVFLVGLWNAGSFAEEEALVEDDSLNEEEGNWGGAKERKEREEDKEVGNDGRWWLDLDLDLSEREEEWRGVGLGREAMGFEKKEERWWYWFVKAKTLTQFTLRRTEWSWNERVLQGTEDEGDT